MRRLGLRWLLLWPLLLIVLLALTGLAVYVERTASNDQIEAVDIELSRVAQQVAGNPRGQPAPPVDDDDTVADAPVRFVLGVGAAVEPGSTPFTAEQIAALEGVDGYVTVDTELRHRVLVRQLPDGAALVSALPLDQVDASIAGLRRSLVVGGIVIFLLVSVVVMAIATTITRPARRLSLAANRIAAGEFDTPIDARTRSREIGDLADDLGWMVDRLTTSLAESRRLTAEATRARDDMQRFLADASHELRTPLTSLKGYSDLYARQMLSEPGHLDRAMERIGSESERLTDLVNDMLRLASDGAASDLEPEPVDLVDVAGDVVDDIGAGFPDHSVVLRADTGGAVVLGDRARLHQAVLNLGANACQYGGVGAEVSIEVRSNVDEVTVAVVDHGPGIDADISDKVFLPFFRGDASRRRDGRGGAGLGLALTRQIIDRHGGRIEIETTPGGGATFVVTIPARRA